MADEKKEKSRRVENALQVFTDMLIKRMEDASNSLSWTQGWANGTSYSFGLPQNIMGNVYTGGNAFLLQMISGENGYSMPVFMTFMQAKDLGVKVNKGEKSVSVFKWGFTVIGEDKKKIPLEVYEKMTEEEKKKCDVRPYLKAFPEFNIDQTNFADVHPERYEALKKKFGTIEVAQDSTGMYKNEALDRVIEGEGNWVCPIHLTSENRAYYIPSENAIHVPKKEKFNMHPDDINETFKDGQEYYSTILHEMAHSTGHETLLNRPGITNSDGFGGKVYAKEELVAELTAAMVSNTLGFDKRITENSAAYLKGWAMTLRQEPRYIVSVIADVNKASKIELERIDEQRKALGLKPLLEGNLDGIEEKEKNAEQLNDIKSVEIAALADKLKGGIVLDGFHFTKEGTEQDEPMYRLETETVKNQAGQDRTIVMEYAPLSEKETFSVYYQDKETQLSEPYENLSPEAKEQAIAYMDGKLKEQWKVVNWNDFTFEGSQESIEEPKPKAEEPNNALLESIKAAEQKILDFDNKLKQDVDNPQQHLKDCFREMSMERLEHPLRHAKNMGDVRRYFKGGNDAVSKWVQNASDAALIGASVQILPSFTMNHKIGRNEYDISHTYDRVHDKLPEYGRYWDENGDEAAKERFYNRLRTFGDILQRYKDNISKVEGQDFNNIRERFKIFPRNEYINGIAMEEEKTTQAEQQVMQGEARKPMQWAGYYSNLNAGTDIEVAIDDDQLKSLYASGNAEGILAALKDAQKSSGAEWSMDNLQSSASINTSEVVAEDDKYIVTHNPDLEQPFVMYEKVSEQQILEKIKQQGLSEDDSEIAHSVANNDVARHFKEMPTAEIEMPNGESVYLSYDEATNKVIAGGATNVGQIHEHEFVYDHNYSFVENLQDIESQLQEMEEYQSQEEEEEEAVAENESLNISQQEQGQQTAQAEEAVDQKNQKKYYVSYAFMQNEEDTQEFDRLQNEGDYDGILRLAAELDQGDALDQQYVTDKSSRYPGDDTLCENENYAVVYNNETGGTYSLLARYSENDIRESIERYGLDDNASEPVKEVASNYVAEHFDSLDLREEEMPNGYSLFASYNKDTRNIEVGDNREDAEAVKETFPFDFNKSISQNLTDIWKEMSKRPEFQQVEEDGQSIQDKQAEEKVDPKDEKKYFVQYAYIQDSEGVQDLDKLKEQRNFTEMLSQAEQLDQEQPFELGMVSDKERNFSGDTIVCSNEDYTMVQNNGSGGDYSLLKRVSENEIREEIMNQGWLGDDPNNTVKEIARNLAEDQFKELSEPATIKLPSGETFEVRYNRGTDNLELGHSNGNNFEVIEKHYYEYGRSMEDNIHDVETDMTQDYKKYQIADQLANDEKLSKLHMDNGTILDIKYDKYDDKLDAYDNGVIVGSQAYDHTIGLEQNVGGLWEVLDNKPEYKNIERSNIAKEFNKIQSPSFIMPNGEKLDYQYDYDTNKVNVGHQPEQALFEIKHMFEYNQNRSVAENMLAIYSTLSQKEEYQREAKQDIKVPHEDGNIATDVATDAKEFAATGIPMERAEVMAKEKAEDKLHDEYHKEQDRQAAEDKSKAEAVKAAEQEKKKAEEQKAKDEKKKEAKPMMVVTHAALLLSALASAKEKNGVWLNSGYRDNASFMFSQTPISGYNNLLMNMHSEQKGYRSNVYTYYDQAKQQGLPVMAGQASLPFSWTNWQYVNEADKSKTITSKQYNALSKEERKLYHPRSVRMPQRIYNIDQTIFPAKAHDSYVEVLKQHGDKVENVPLDREYGLLSQYTQMSKKHPGDILIMVDDDTCKTYKAGAAKLHEAIGVSLGKAEYNGKDVDYAEFPKNKLSIYLQKLLSNGTRVGVVNKIDGAKLIKQVPDPDKVLNNAYSMAKTVAKTADMGYERVMVVQPAMYDEKANKLVVSGMSQTGTDTVTAAVNKANDIYRALAAAMGTEQRLDRGGRNHLTPFDDDKYDKLVQELSAGVFMSRQGLPSTISKENMELIPYWERELKECPRLMGMIERDVNNTVEVIENLSEGRKPNYSKILGNAPKKEIRTKADYAAIKKINDFPSVEFKEFVVVKNTKDSIAQVILPAGASLAVDNEISGMRKDRIKKALENDGFKGIKFYNAGGALGLKEPNEYFADKEVSVAKLNQYKAVETQKLNLDKYVTKPVPQIETFRCLKNDDGKYFFLIKPAKEEAFCIEPEKVHLNSFFQAKDKNDMKKALGEMYYKLTSAHPDVKKDFITPKPVDVDYSRIERAGMMREKDGKKVIHAVVDGKYLKKQVTQSQWDRLWFAKDKKSYAHRMAAIVFGPELKASKGQEQNMFQGQQQDEKKESKQSAAVDSSASHSVGRSM